MTTTKKARIKNGICGSGDDMKTSLINGERIPKSHKVIRIFGCQERFSNDLQYFIYKYGKYKIQTQKLYKNWFNILPKFVKTFLENFEFLNKFIYKVDTEINHLEKEDIDVLSWLVVNLNNLGAFCYWKGEKDEFCFPVEFLNYINERIDYFQDKLEDCQDFLTFTDEKYILLDRCRIDVRELESSYAVWYEYCFGKTLAVGNLSLMSSILNRLSTYLFFLNRYLMLKNNVEERPWCGGVSKFPKY